MFPRFFKDTMKETGLCVGIILTAEMLKTQAAKLEKVAESILKNNQPFLRDGRSSPGPNTDLTWLNRFYITSVNRTTKFSKKSYDK